MSVESASANNMIITMRGYSDRGDFSVTQARVSILQIPFIERGRYSVDVGLDVDTIQMSSRVHNTIMDMSRIDLSASVDLVATGNMMVTSSFPVELVRDKNTFVGSTRFEIDIRGSPQIELALSSRSVGWRDIDLTLLINSASLVLTSSD